MFDKPIVFFDIESTGTNVATDKIISIALVKVTNFGEYTESTKTLDLLLNPQRAIDNSHIHGITNEMVREKPVFRAVAQQIYDFIGDCDLAGYNAKVFDIPLLLEELNRCNFTIPMDKRRVFDVLALYRKINPSNLSAVYKKYTGLELQGAHGALADTQATVAIMRRMIGSGEIPAEPSGILDIQDDKSQVDMAGKFVRNDEGVIVFNFGRYKGQPALFQKDYLIWMLKGDFTADTKEAIRQILNEAMKRPDFTAEK